MCDAQVPSSVAKMRLLLPRPMAAASLFLALFLISSCTAHSLNASAGRGDDVLASAPPRGWNSYDSFGWVVSEEEFLQNAQILSEKLLPYGYEYVVVDYLWYRRLVGGASRDSYGYDVIDEWGRVIPDPGRWPSSRGGNGFKDVARKVHEMGLKFGIHVMRGISVQAADADTPILDVSKGDAYEEGGRKWRARDIALRDMSCGWMKNGFMSVDTDLGAGRAFLRSLYRQYAEWGVDFVKLDCVFGNDLDIKEFVMVSELLEELDRPVLFSVSPGTSVTPDMAKLVSNHVNMYRITGDDWDTWPDIESHFDIARDIAAAELIGAPSLRGRSWPDLDMLPLGWLTDSYGNEGPYRKCNLMLDEKKSQLTLWSIARSPLIYGGDLRNLDEETSNLITNPAILEINSFSANNMEFSRITAILESRGGLRDGARNLENLITDEEGKLGLVSCKDPMAKGWFAKKHDGVPGLICTNDTTGRGSRISYCLQEQKLLNQLKGNRYRQKHQKLIRLLAMENIDLCLDAFAARKLTASRLPISLSPCKWKTNQIWELNENGTLMSSYSGLCATLEAKRDYSNAGGVRSWIATGGRGEVYLSFFNLNSVNAEMSANLWDIAQALPSGSLGKGSCKAIEHWTAKDLGLVNETLSFLVASHGCALFKLRCD